MLPDGRQSALNSGFRHRPVRSAVRSTPLLGRLSSFALPSHSAPLNRLCSSLSRFARSFVHFSRSPFTSFVGPLRGPTHYITGLIALTRAGVQSFLASRAAPHLVIPLPPPLRSVVPIRVARYCLRQFAALLFRP